MLAKACLNNTVQVPSEGSRRTSGEPRWPGVESMHCETRRTLQLPQLQRFDINTPVVHVPQRNVRIMSVAWLQTSTADCKQLPGLQRGRIGYDGFNTRPCFTETNKLQDSAASEEFLFTKSTDFFRVDRFQSQRSRQPPIFRGLHAAL